MSRIFNTWAVGFLLLLGQLCSNAFAQVRYPFHYSSFVWNRPLQDVAFGNGAFVAISRVGTILTSKDGMHWSNHSSDINVLQTNCANINFSTETYSAGGDTVTFMLADPLPDPPDLIENHPSLLSYWANMIPRPLHAITFGHGTFVIVGDAGLTLTSPDGEHWVAGEHRTPKSFGSFYGVAAGGSGFVAVGQNGIIYTSPDGLAWTQRDSGTDLLFYSVAYGNGTYVAFADNGTTHTSVFTSNDGMTWTANERGLGQINSIAFGNGVFLGTMTFDRFPPQLVGERPGKWTSGPTVISSDGKNWREVAPPIPSEGLGPFKAYFPTHLTFGGGRFIATAFGVISTSKDGMHWTPSTGLNSEYFGAAYGNGVYVAVGNGVVTKDNNTVSLSAVTITHSKDEITWEPSQCPPSRLLWGNIINKHTFKIAVQRRNVLGHSGQDTQNHMLIYAKASLLITIEIMHRPGQNYWRLLPA